MKIDILTLFPNMFDGFLNESIIKRAREKGLIEINIHDIRDYTLDPHKKVDDYPYGGGRGMVLMCQPVVDAIESLKKEDSKVILMCPQGIKYEQKIAYNLKYEKHLILVCGHYEGYDERIREIIKPREISIGDFVLTGGELPAMVLVDCFARLIDGVLGSDASAKDESFSDNLLEYPQYTRPAVFRDMAVPEVLLNGNHAEIAKWRREQSIRLTYERRPELLKRADLTRKDLQYMERLKSREQENNE